ncbi:DpnII family type II restriction endonuclease [Phenylobacterium sp.]|uniref:DpnII family type II restriction endonuclease n=1 Tax=Phenylobacterium sp. TaxID=1871053 RepID=UPI002FC58EE7
MRVVNQTLEEIFDSLSALDVEWMDKTAASTIARLIAIEEKPEFGRSDIEALLAENFDEGILCVRLFLGLSDDKMDGALREELGNGGIGIKRYKADGAAYLDALERLGLPEKMAATVNHKPVWNDILVERLRSGRGSAVSGQQRGRGLENFVESVIKEVFGDGGYVARDKFVGERAKTAKFDFAIPDKVRPRIILEVKAYGATGSKMSDVIGDLDAIIEAMRRDSTLLFVTDGLTWKRRAADLRKIVERQNEGKIARIYTTGMREQFLDDLRTLKVECGL